MHKSTSRSHRLVWHDTPCNPSCSRIRQCPSGALKTTAELPAVGSARRRRDVLHRHPESAMSRFRPVVYTKTGIRIPPTKPDRPSLHDLSIARLPDDQLVGPQLNAQHDPVLTSRFKLLDRGVLLSWAGRAPSRRTRPPRAVAPGPWPAASATCPLDPLCTGIARPMHAEPPAPSWQTLPGHCA